MRLLDFVILYDATEPGAEFGATTALTWEREVPERRPWLDGNSVDMNRIETTSLRKYSRAPSLGGRPFFMPYEGKKLA